MNSLSAGLVVVAVPACLAVALGGACDIAAAVFGLAWLGAAAREATTWSRRPRWTKAERDALNGRASLKRVLAGRGAQHERRFR